MPSTLPVRFFAPTYFSPFYFAPLVVDRRGPGGGPGVSSRLTYRDRDAFAALIAALRDTGEFADVLFGTTADRRVAGADRTPVAVVTPDGWAEADDVDPVVVVRQVAFTLTLVVRDEDPGDRYDALDRLSDVALNVVDGSDLGGGCLPALTRLRRGRFDTNPIFPEQSLVLHGEFAYLIPSFDGHSTDS